MFFVQEVSYCTRGGISIEKESAQTVSGGSESVSVRLSHGVKHLPWRETEGDRIMSQTDPRFHSVAYHSGPGSGWADWVEGGRVRMSHGDASAIVVNTRRLSFTWLSSCGSGFNKCCWIRLPFAWLLHPPQLHKQNIMTTYTSDKHIRLWEKRIISYYQGSIWTTQLLLVRDVKRTGTVELFSLRAHVLFWSDGYY